MTSRSLATKAPLIVSLDDDLEVLLRPPVKEDKERVRRAYAMLSADSRMNRFWEKPVELSQSRAESLTDVDNRNHVAWVALPIEEGALPGYAGASFWRSREEPERAELAFTVADAYQRRGLATLLFSILWLEAWEIGVRTFVGYSRPRNEGIIRWWEGIGGEVTVGPYQAELRWKVECPEDFLNRVPFEMPPSLRRVEIAQWMERWLDELGG